MMNTDLITAGWIMIHESGVYSHPDVNTGYPFTESEALTKSIGQQQQPVRE